MFFASATPCHERSTPCLSHAFSTCATSVPAGIFPLFSNIRSVPSLNAHSGLLKVVPDKLLGIMIPIVGIGLLVVWPFLDRSPEVLIRRRKIVVGGATIILVALVALTIRGYLS